MIDPFDTVKPIWFSPIPTVGIKAFVLVKKTIFWGLWKKVIYCESNGKWYIKWFPNYELSRYSRTLYFKNVNSLKTTTAYEMWFEHTDDRIKARNIKKWMSIWQKKDHISLANV